MEYTYPPCCLIVELTVRLSGDPFHLILQLLISPHSSSSSSSCPHMNHRIIICNYAKVLCGERNKLGFSLISGGVGCIEEHN